MKKVIIVVSCLTALSCASNKTQENRHPAQIGNVGTFSTSVDNWKSTVLKSVEPYYEKRTDGAKVIRNIKSAFIAIDKVRAKYKGDRNGCDSLSKDTRDLIKVSGKDYSQTPIKSVLLRMNWCEPYFEQGIGFITFEMNDTKEQIMLGTSGSTDQCVVYNGRPHTTEGYKVYCFGAKRGSGLMEFPYVDAYVISHDGDGKNLKLESMKTVDLPFSENNY